MTNTFAEALLHCLCNCELSHSRQLTSSANDSRAEEQPLKIPFAAAIVLYANQDKPEFAKMILEITAEKTQSALEAGQLRKFKLLLRFLGCLQDLFESGGVFDVLGELFDRAVDLQTASSEDVCGEIKIMGDCC